MRRAMMVGLAAQVWVFGVAGGCSKKPPTKKKAAWDGSKALRCEADEEIGLEGKEIRTSSITIDGACRVTLKGCTFTSNTSVYISKNGSLTIEGGALKGSSHSFNLKDTSRATLRGVTNSGDLNLQVTNQAILELHKSKLRGSVWPKDTARVTLDEVELRKGSFHVSDKAQVTLRRSSILRKHSNGMYLSDKAVVTLLDSTIRAYTAIDARGDVRVRIQGGTLAGKRIAIQASGRALVGYRKVTLEGQVKTSGKAMALEGWNADPDAPSFKRVLAFQKARAKYDRRACLGVSACIRDHGTKRFAVGRIVANVASDGTITLEKMVLTKRTKPKVRACIRKLYDKVRIPDFAAPPGKLVCEYHWIMSGRRGYRGRTTSRYIPTGSPLPPSAGPLPDAKGDSK